MNVTISTHNGSAVAREHNIRNPKVVSKESHIDPQGIHETWIDEPVRQAYKRLFGDSVAAYNAKQNREERRIRDYYTQICNDKKKHPVYEMIIGIYGKNEDGSPICSAETGKEIMKRFVDEWGHRNPNLELIGAYYHADEQGEPHVHIDYIPVAHGYQKGLETQTAFIKALGEQGFAKKTAQIMWEARENAFLEELCNEHGLTVDHPQKDGSEHLHTAKYKAVKELEQLENTLSEQKKELSALEGRILKAEEVKAIEGKKSLTGALKGVSYEDYLSLKKTAQKVQKVQAENRQLKAQIANLENRNSLLQEQVTEKKERERALFSREKLKEAEKQANADNKNRLLCQALGIPETSTYDQARQILLERGLVHQKSKGKSL